MHASKLLKRLQPCIAALPDDPKEDTSGQAWLRSTAALLQSDAALETDQVQDLLNEGLWAVRNIPDLTFPKPERSYVGLIPASDDPECEIVSIDELEEEMISSGQAILLAKVI
jgi:hypothetical protein